MKLILRTAVLSTLFILASCAHYGAGGSCESKCDKKESCSEEQCKMKKEQCKMHEEKEKESSESETSAKK